MAIMALAAVILGVGALLTWMEARAARKAIQDTMLAQALMLGATFDVDKIAGLTGTLADLTASDHHYLRNQLIHIRNANPRYRYLYFFGRREGSPPFFFMGTAAEDSANYSPPGQVYFEESPTLNRVFADRVPAVSSPFTDRWGTWVSALVPIVDPSNGNLLAVFGMDVDAGQWQNEIRRRALMPAMATGVTILLMGIGIGYWRRRQLAGHLVARRQAEEALRDSERKYRLIAENAADIIFTMDTRFRFTYVSPSVYRIKGFTPEEAMALSLEQMVPPKSLEKAHRAIASASDFLEREDFGSTLTIELEQFRKDGSAFWTENEISFMLDESGKAVGIIGVSRDVGRRKTAEKALQASEDRFRSMIQSASDMIFIVDADGLLSYESPSVSRILGYPEGFFLGQSPFALIHPDDLELVKQEMELVYRLTNDGSPTVFRLKRPTGEWIWLEALASNQHENLSIRGIIVTARDISERKRAEQDKETLNAQLLQAQKMEAVGHLAGGIAHDFNNMLSVVIGHAEMAMNAPDLETALYKRFKTIHEAALRSADLVRQLLAYARRQTISPKVLDINTTIAGMLSMLHRFIGEDIDLAWVPGQDIGQIRIDPSQLDQVLANLMVNARDAIAGVGKVTIETANVRLDDAYCADHSYCTPGDYVMLALSDSGCGMDAHTLTQIFDPFFTTKGMGKGTGLGLATVYGIVKQNEGFINVYSEPGRGTTFRIYLPRVDEPIGDQPQALPDHTVRRGTGTILIVEDDAAILELGKSILNQFGYTVLTAETPARALDVAREHTGRIDLVITDVVMPQMNGRDLIFQLEAILPGFKCLFMSGYTANVIAHHGVLEEGVHFLQKPFSVKELIDKVAEVLSG